jgi:hypothetical protein
LHKGKTVENYKKILICGEIWSSGVHV